MCGRHRSSARRAPASRLRPDDVRPSDAEREDVVAQLRHHAGDGRLDTPELEARVEQAYTATRRRDLVALTADLPRAPRRRRDERAELAEHVRSYLSVMALLVVIWALTGMGYFWPVWPIVGWGVFVVQHAAAARRPPRRHRLPA